MGMHRAGRCIVVMLLFSFVGPLLYPTNQIQPNLLQITLAGPVLSSRSAPMRSATTCWAG